jgi:hypothetical protein
MALTYADGLLITDLTITQSMIANGAVGAAQIAPLNALPFANTITANTTIPSGQNWLSVGPLTAANGNNITISANSRWVIL